MIFVIYFIAQICAIYQMRTSKMPNSTDIAVILFTKNWAGKAQAGSFSLEEAERATQGARKHGASALAFTSHDDADLLAALPKGRFGEHDRPLLTAIRQDIYKQLAGLADAKAGLQPSAQDALAAAPDVDTCAPEKKATGKRAAAMGAQPDAKASEVAAISVVMKEGKTHWPSLKPGDLVLAPDSGDDGYNGWWEATVKARSDSHVTLEWTDYPELPSFTRPITQIAMRHPECKL